MNNELRTIVRAYSQESIKAFAPKIGMSKNTVTKLIARSGLPRQVKIETLDRIAGYFGYEVVISFRDKSMVYDAKFGDDKICSCGHPYHRHFDSYDDMRPVGCKYCDCGKFRGVEE